MTTETPFPPRSAGDREAGRPHPATAQRHPPRTPPTSRALGHGGNVCHGSGDRGRRRARTVQPGAEAWPVGAARGPGTTRGASPEVQLERRPRRPAPSPRVAPRCACAHTRPFPPSCRLTVSLLFPTCCYLVDRWALSAARAPPTTPGLTRAAPGDSARLSSVPRAGVKLTLSEPLGEGRRTRHASRRSHEDPRILAKTGLLGVGQTGAMGSQPARPPAGPYRTRHAAPRLPIICALAAKREQTFRYI